MLDNGAVLLLRTEQDDLCILGNGDRMAGGPVEKITAVDGFFRSARVGHRDLALNHIAPMWGLTQVTLGRILQMEPDDGLPLPILQPEVAGKLTVVLVHPPIPFTQVVELAAGDVGRHGMNRLGPDAIHDLVQKIIFRPICSCRPVEDELVSLPKLGLPMVSA